METHGRLIETDSPLLPKTTNKMRVAPGHGQPFKPTCAVGTCSAAERDQRSDHQWPTYLGYEVQAAVLCLPAPNRFQLGQSIVPVGAAFNCSAGAGAHAQHSRHP